MNCATASRISGIQEARGSSGGWEYMGLSSYWFTVVSSERITLG